MKTRRVRDPRAFQAATEAYLLGEEANHNLLLGLLATLIERPDVYPDFHLWIVEDADQIVGAALMTPPFNVILATPLAEGAVEALAAELLRHGVSVPGVIAARGDVDTFLGSYLDPAGLRIGSRQEQAIHVLDHVESVRSPSGMARRATLDDLELVLEWSRAFNMEAGPQAPWDEERARRNLRHKIPDGSGGGMRIWEDEGAVCLVGFVEATPRTARVGPVYTPPAVRNKGYATALTAHVSRELLQQGKQQCLLYTDLANPTSNAIYRRIGYRVVSNSAMVTFEENR